MNWKLLGTMVTLIGVGASVALGQGTTPTIVQGDYISNVFGNSNFIKNPNAKLNNANVTVSSATVTRSTSTPLVATSEFLVTTSTATGSATWSTRTFDGGMKGQNCEARFTYRGFSVGSTTAQILQGANVVAQLTLTASTDPRIASINFPCGDLSSATTFRLQQATASLTGTNEIGGIYVGLATNMANVAQAEFVGSLKVTGCTSSYSTPSNTPSYSTAWSFSPPTGCIYTATGNLDAPTNTAKPGFKLKNDKAGTYFITVQGTVGVGAPTSGGGNGSIRIENGSVQSSETYFGDSTTSASLYPGGFQATIAYSTIGDPLFYFSAKTQINNTLSVYGTNTYPLYISVYRFPSSSELVVKPETQNVFGGVKWPGNADFSQTSTIANTIVNTTNFGTPTAFGKAAIASSACGLTTNDIGVCFQNVPPGTYEVTTALETGAIWNFGTAGAALCNVRVEASGTSLANTYVASALTEVATSGAEDLSVVSSGTFTVTSFQPTLALAVRMSKSSNTGRCLIRSQSTGNNYVALPTITMKAIDQPSNSALYVQGPVLGAQTGAAIPSGYAGENLSNLVGYNTMTSNAYNALGTRTLTDGVYLVSAQVGWLRNAATFTGALGVVAVSTNTRGYSTGSRGYTSTVFDILNYDEGEGSIGVPAFIVRVQSGTMYFPDGSTSVGDTTLKVAFYPGTFTGGPITAQGLLTVLRIN